MTSSLQQQIDQMTGGFHEAGQVVSAWGERIGAELDFARRIAEQDSRRKAEFESLIQHALTMLDQHGSAPNEQIVLATENILRPIVPAAKAYVLHCIGHAHIDMNWLWNWPETVAVVNDTFTTVDRLMDEFPEFRFSQSQAAIYAILKDYLPELWEKVKLRVKEGRWEVTASHWVEGDKNLASGEILCRHLLYTRQFFTQEMGLLPDTVRIDFQPDTFGHCATIPGFLGKGGVRWYYMHRGARGPRMFRWRGKDGTTVLVYNDWDRGYNGALSPAASHALVEFEALTGMKEMAFVYGVGDHGGGPTRRDLRMGQTMSTWPVFPTIRFSTLSDFFTIAEKSAQQLPVHEGEMNSVFEGCYTSQSNIKKANRRSEYALVEAEACALLGGAWSGMHYPSESLLQAWKHAMFNQFHDILPGSGIHATYEHAQGLYQEILARTTMAKTRSLRSIAAKVNTRANAASLPNTNPSNSIGPGFGAGAGQVLDDGRMTRYAQSGESHDHFVIFNPSPWKREEVATVSLWHREWLDSQIVVIDDAGRSLPGQVVARDPGWGGLNRIDVAFPTGSLPPMGYRSFCLARSINPGTGSGVTSDHRGVLENEHLRVEIEESTGAIIHMIDKSSGVDLVPSGTRCAQLEHVVETGAYMSAWMLGQEKQVTPLRGTIDGPLGGPHMATVRVVYEVGSSRITQTITLTTGSRRVDITLEIDWREQGSPQAGIPGLRVVCPIDVSNGVASFECANGHVERPTVKEQIPSYTYYLGALQSYVWGTNRVALTPGVTPGQRWIDLTGERNGEKMGVSLYNDSKYGFSILGNVLMMSLIRSSYEPDPLPEMGRHVIRYALEPHGSAWTPSVATRKAHDFNLPLNAVTTTEHDGELAGQRAGVELLTANTSISGFKKAEESNAIILRIYETDGKETTAQVRIDQALIRSAVAVETDILERPLTNNRSSLNGNILSVGIKPFETVSIRIG